VITEKEYKKRRTALAKSLKANSVAILFSARPKTRSNDTEYPYRQNSNFYYLTGFKEDNSTLLIVKESKKYKAYLFVQKKDKALELWTGKRMGDMKAKELFLLDDVYESELLSEKLKELVVGKHQLYYDFTLESSKAKLIKKESKNIMTHMNVAKNVERLRLIKSEAEVELIKKALEITQDAHHIAMEKSRHLTYEYELQAEIEYIFRKNGAYSDAYTSIVASGNAANTLHYISNDKVMQKDSLILIDAGCEYDYYSSDITRSIPTSGKFTKAQKELYEMVLDVEKEIIKMIKPNVLRSDLQSKSEELLCKGMVDLGILKGDVKKLLKDKAHKKYYPHGIGHWMGLDVHDQCPYKDDNLKEIPLQVGMVMTIEPGLYLDAEDKQVPKKYRGIGIRIEDDILVKEDGCEVLSAGIAKEIADIEKIAYS
jgi:Xaa-Pro aminopeptidase